MAQKGTPAALREIELHSEANPSAGPSQAQNMLTEPHVTLAPKSSFEDRFLEMEATFREDMDSFLGLRFPVAVEIISK